MHSVHIIETAARRGKIIWKTHMVQNASLDCAAQASTPTAAPAVKIAEDIE